MEVSENAPENMGEMSQVDGWTGLRAARKEGSGNTQTLRWTDVLQELKAGSDGGRLAGSGPVEGLK